MCESFLRPVVWVFKLSFLARNNLQQWWVLFRFVFFPALRGPAADRQLERQQKGKLTNERTSVACPEVGSRRELRLRAQLFFLRRLVGDRTGSDRPLCAYVFVLFFESGRIRV